MAPRVLAILATAVTATLLAMGTASATHPQPVGPSQTFAAFDHIKGNEWWVEMQLLGYEACDGQTTVHARDEGGAWTPLQRPSWAAPCGRFVGSFHIEPGNRVQFRSHYHDSFTVESCWFAHPQGEEQCGDESEFVARFMPKAANEWWVQVAVDGNMPIAAVDARADGGAWRPLELKSWGDWAASFHAPAGTIVEFRARSAAGQQDFSQPGYKWTSMDAYPQPGAEPPTFRARFHHAAGNEWWVQVNTYSTQRPDGVTARVDGGAWHPLELKEWGDWAASIHAPSGSIVEFRTCAGPGGHCEQSGPHPWPPA